MRKAESRSRSTPAEDRYRKLFAEMEGESLVQMGARTGIAPGTLKWWRYELRRRDQARGDGEAAVTVVGAPPRPVPMLLPVHVVDAGVGPAPDGAPSYDVMLAGGRRVLRVPARFDPGAVRALVAALEGAPC